MKNLNQSVKENSLFNDSLTEQKIEQDSFISYSEYIDYNKLSEKYSKYPPIDYQENIGILSRYGGKSMFGMIPENTFRKVEIENDES